MYQQLPSLKQDSLVVLLVGQSLAQRRLQQQQLRLLKQPDQQRRHLQTETLVLDLSVSGLFDTLNTTTTSTATSTASFQGRLQLIFRDHAQEFLNALQDTPDPYFDTITEVFISSTSPVLSPTSPPAISTTEPATNDDDDPLRSLGTIIGIAAGGGALLLLVAIILYRAIKKEPKAKTPKPTSNQSDPAALDDDDNGDGHHTSPRKSWIQKRAESQSNREGLDSASDLLENQTLYSYQDNTSASFAMGGPSHFNDTDTINGADTMSYAYSLDAGIEPSVMGDSTMDMGHEESIFTAPPPKSSRIQIPSEIPSIMLVPHQIGGNEGPPSSQWSNHSYDIDDPSEFGVDTTMDLISPTTVGSEGDFELTNSELAMLPSNLNATSSNEAYTSTRYVYAPPGKLGIVIDTTVEGPVVHKVNTNSSLAEQIWPGDIIVAIDDVDTRAMSATAITQLMVQTANQRRTLTVVSGEA